jgi:hypothetical protein
MQNIVLLLAGLSLAVLGLYLDRSDQLVGATVTHLQNDLAQGLLFAIVLFIFSLDAQGLIQLVDSYKLKLDEDLAEQSAAWIVLQVVVIVVVWI